MESPRANENDMLFGCEFKLVERSKSTIWRSPRGQHHAHEDAVRLALKAYGFSPTDAAGDVWDLVRAKKYYTRSGAVQFVLDQLERRKKAARKAGACDG